jgi:hypothetical protein
MSCPGDNYIVPGANPCAGGGGGGGGVQSITAGTPNVTIGGTVSIPSISVSGSGGVTQVEGQSGNVNLNGVGITVLGGSPSLGDVTLTATVQNVTGAGVATVSQPTPGTFQVSVPAPTPATVTNILTSGVATVSNAGTVFTVGVPAPAYPVTNITGSGIASVSNAGTVFNVDVPTPDVSNILTTGIATVTNAGSVFTIDVPAPTPATVTNVLGSGAATVSNAGSVYTVTVPIPVDSLNGLTGLLTCISSDASLTITPSGTDIDFKIVGVPPVSGVTSVNAESGVLTITGGPGITVNTTAGNIEIQNTKAPDVITLNGLDGALNITSTELTVTPAGTDIAIEPNSNYFPLSCFLTMTNQTYNLNGFTLAPGTTSYFDVVDNNNFTSLANFLPFRTHIIVQINAPVITSANFNANALSYGFVWGQSAGPTPSQPVSLTLNQNQGGTTTGIIGNAKLTTAELTNPLPTNDQLYFVVNNLSAVNTYTITEFPNFLQFFFYNP